MVSPGRVVLSALAAGAVSATSPGLASATTTAEPADSSAVPRPATVTQHVAAQQQAARPGAVLTTGTQGPRVRELQRVLNAWYPSQTPLAQNGVYSAETEDRVRLLQERAGITVDGLAGPETLGTLHMAPAPATGSSGQPATQDSEPAPSPDEAGGEAPQPQAAPGGIVSPTTGELTSEFGERGGDSHGGIDIANEIGTPIYSTAAGEVIEAGPASGFGQWVRVQHTDGTISVYGHISEALVSAGDKVTAGEQIAEMGNEGQSTGPHLHFEILQDGGEKVDPLSWLQDHGVSL